MSGIGWQISIIFLLIAAHGFWVLSETAVITARKSRLREWIANGNRRAKIILELALAPNRLVIGTQASMTVITLVIGVFAGRSMTPTLAAALVNVPAIGRLSEEIALGFWILSLAFFSLVVGQLVPRRIALGHAEAIATFVARPLQFLIRLLSPVICCLDLCSEALSARLTRQAVNKPPVTEDEIKSLVKQGAEAGLFQESEQDMLEAVLSLGDKSARSLMTPRTQITWLDIDDSAEGIREKLVSSAHSCFPVATGSLDKVDGVVQSKNLLAYSLGGNTPDLRTLIHPPLFVPRTITALEVLESFKNSGEHIALVVDEYGGIEGLLTDHDILEAIAGDISFGGKPNDPKAVRRHDGSWLLDGMLSIDEFKEIFQLDALPGEKRDAYQTLGGFVFTKMGQIPSVSDSFEWNGLRFEVVDMDGKRIDKVLVASVCDDREQPSAPLNHGSEGITKKSSSETQR